MAGRVGRGGSSQGERQPDFRYFKQVAQAADRLGRHPVAAGEPLGDGRLLHANAHWMACVIEPLADRITAELAVPVIGIGASARCDCIAC